MMIIERATGRVVPLFCEGPAAHVKNGCLMGGVLTKKTSSKRHMMGGGVSVRQVELLESLAAGGSSGWDAALVTGVFLPCHVVIINALSM